MLVIVFILAIDIIFFKVPDSLLFDAPLLALAAILLVMSTRNLDCLELMNALPDISFPIPFQQNEVSLDMLRVDDCLQTFEKITVDNVNNDKRKFQDTCGEEVSLTRRWEWMVCIHSEPTLTPTVYCPGLSSLS